MRRGILLIWLLVLTLTGCTNARYDSEVILSEIPDDEGSEGLSDTDVAGSVGEIVTYDVSIEPETVVVYVCGEVISPGVYELDAGSRINDAVIAAGGFSDDADESYVNLAATVSDGTKLKIPSKEEIQNEQKIGIDSFDFNVDINSSEKKLININSASKEELKTIPGIGDGIAGKIMDYRDKNGKFSCIEDIMKVSGIKDKLFSKIRDYITV